MDTPKTCVLNFTINQCAVVTAVSKVWNTFNIYSIVAREQPDPITESVIDYDDVLLDTFR